MSSNQSLLAKADMTMAELTANGGALLPEQANTFIRKLIISPTILKDVRTVTMTASQRKINKIYFGSRILKPGVSGTPLVEGDRSKPTTEQVVLETDEVIAEVRIPYDVMEDNIESASAANNEASNTGPGGLRNTLIQMIAERVAVDLEEMGLLANDAVAGQGTLSLTDGWLQRASDNGNVVDIENAAISKNVFKLGTKAMPDQYLRNRASMRHYVSQDNETEYRDTLANRGTALGDNMIQGLQPVYAYSVPVVACHQMPEAKGLFTNPLNLIMGVQRDISMEYDKDITARVYIIVVTARVAFQVEEDDALVLYTNIGSAD
jgi:hypothetical protein